MIVVNKIKSENTKKIQAILVERFSMLAPATVLSYSRTLSSLYWLKNPNTEIDFEWFKNIEEVEDAMKDRPMTSKKTIYAALVNITELPYYSNKVNDLRVEIDKYNALHVKSEKQQGAWKSMDEIRQIYDDLAKKTKYLFSKTAPWTQIEMQDASNFVLFVLTCGLFFEPRRTKDWTEMKNRDDIDIDKDNYIDGNFFVFNSYKTATTYGKVLIEIPREVKLILNKYIKRNPHQYLLVQRDGKKLTNVNVTQRLNALYGTNISTSMLRHIYLTEKYGQALDTINNLKESASKMGNDFEMAISYIKR